ncbi:MAG: hypothetical protein ACXWNI_01585 [Candidatus Limnocylindrales bacterium]
MIVFDTNGQVLASNATLDGGPPAPPIGVLAAARPGSPNAVTWQPRDGVRVAAVVVAWKGGTVLAGRSLRLVEQREANAELIAGAAWARGGALIDPPAATPAGRDIYSQGVSGTC